MHIPTCESSELDILSFDEALKNSGSRGDYDADKWLYVPDYYADYRYILGTRGSDPLICIGINPSTAAPDDLDNTLKSVARIADANGYDSWIMFNVYAQRATNPDDMDIALNEKLHRENMRAFEYILNNVGEGISPAIWAAWGTIIEKRPYLRDCVLDMVRIGQSYGANWFSAGKRSKKGHPHHPLYLRKDAVTEPFDIEEYLEVIK
ncbi:MAG TPA: hypothetical protein DIT84_02930 [Clostridiales bacterium]|nr:hypothetical protein [Clostridiales bacterium]